MEGRVQNTVKTYKIDNLPKIRVGGWEEGKTINFPCLHQSSSTAWDSPFLLKQPHSLPLLFSPCLVAVFDPDLFPFVPAIPTLLFFSLTPVISCITILKASYPHTLYTSPRAQSLLSNKNTVKFALKHDCITALLILQFNQVFLCWVCSQGLSTPGKKTAF